MAEDGGVIENLPRSRPGKRSEKRVGADAEPGQEAPRAATERPGAAAAEAAERAETASAAAAGQAEPATAAAEAAPAKPSDRARATAEAPSETPPPKPSDRARAERAAGPKPSDRARAKRASGAPAAGRTRATPKARAKAGDKARAKAGHRARAERSAPSGRRQPADPVPEASPGGHPDPVGGLIRGAVKVAGTGVRVAGAVAGEVMRRLPRP